MGFYRLSLAPWQKQILDEILEDLQRKVAREDHFHISESYIDRVCQEEQALKKALKESILEDSDLLGRFLH